MTVKKDDPRTLLEDEIKKRIHFFEVPTGEFNPLTAEPEQLKRYGIPPKPNERDLPALARFWTEMFSPPLKFIDKEFLFTADPVLISRQLQTTASDQRESSSNWSGAYVTPRNGRQFTGVHGRWVVPAVSVPAGTSGTPEFRSSIWIGLDGQRRYFDSSLPQIGTSQGLNSPTDPPFFVWWQWWARNNPGTFHPAHIPITILPGQRMMASIIVVSETQVQFIIENRTSGEIYRSYVMDAPTDISGVQFKVSGATAEWIVERPTNENTSEPYELPDYHKVHFSDCFATSAVMPPAQLPGPGLEETLDGARLINMYKVERNPSRTVTISRTGRPDVDRLEVVYAG